MEAFSQINGIKKAASERRGTDLKMNKTQIEKKPNAAAAFFLLLLDWLDP